MNHELKPCPFCGCNAELIVEFLLKEVRCSRVGCWAYITDEILENEYGGYLDIIDAIESWNLRC